MSKGKNDDDVGPPALKYKETHIKSSNQQVSYVWKNGNGYKKSVVNSARSSTFFNLLKDVFLPESFPSSVSDDYLAYQFWDTLQAFASSISGSLATQAVLQGVGVGDESATALAATITWLLRSGAGMASQIVFTWTQGLDLDHNCKRWRLFADLANDVAMTMELTAPYISEATGGFLSIQTVFCLASVSRTLCGVAGGATRTAITQHQARNNNISDVAAKDGSQETMVNLTALAINLLALPWISAEKSRVWVSFFILTCLHLFANYKAVKSLVFNTLNKDRLLMVLDSYRCQKAVSSTVEVNRKESVFLGFGLNERSFYCGKTISLGVPLSAVLKDSSSTEVVKLVAEHLMQDKFYIGYGDPMMSEQINIILSDTHKSCDLLRAYFVAYQLVHSKCQNSYSTKVNDCVTEFKKFEQNLWQNGWVTSHVQLCNHGWTGSFNT